MHSPDTDVFVLALRRYLQSCENTLFVTGRGQHHHIIELKPTVQTLGPEKIAALPASHALSWANNTGSFSGKGKLLCWKIFAEADSSIITALAELGQAAHPNEEIVAAIEKFVCLPYQPRTKLMTVKELRWSLFKKKTRTIRQVATNTGSIAAGNPESLLPVDGLEQRQNNKPRATITAALWMVDGPRRMGTCHDKPATSSLSDTSTSTVWMLQRKVFH